jgi:hypothetical protein
VDKFSVFRLIHADFVTPFRLSMTTSAARPFEMPISLEGQHVSS